MNDKFGHDIGDEVLVRLAGCMRDCVRRSDTVVRLGGEEFALWLPDASVDAALKIARKVHDRVSAIRLPDGESRVTVSIGVAVSTGGEATGDLRGMLRCADRALYRAKEAGRNCTRVDHGDFGLSTDGAADQSG
ncbi:GGDEF domain-containing protein [Tepidimonas taiwanensis]|uniref:GGDEF domain-containing protein n=1 Tax=Tepidimonas taiwanensis TaxID=307486 RepID=UPI0036F357D8